MTRVLRLTQNYTRKAGIKLNYLFSTNDLSADKKMCKSVDSYLNNVKFFYNLE